MAPGESFASDPLCLIKVLQGYLSNTKDQRGPIPSVSEIKSLYRPRHTNVKGSICYKPVLAGRLWKDLWSGLHKRVQYSSFLISCWMFMAETWVSWETENKVALHCCTHLAFRSRTSTLPSQNFTYIPTGNKTLLGWFRSHNLPLGAIWMARMALAILISILENETVGPL